MDSRIDMQTHAGNGHSSTRHYNNGATVTVFVIVWPWPLTFASMHVERLLQSIQGGPKKWYLSYITLHFTRCRPITFLAHPVRVPSLVLIAEAVFPVRARTNRQTRLSALYPRRRLYRSAWVMNTYNISSIDLIHQSGPDVQNILGLV